MRFHLVDRIREIRGQEIIAAKLISNDDAWLRAQPAGDDAYPPALIVEAVCQAGAWLLMRRTNFVQRAVLLSADAIHIRDKARPGDELTLHVKIESMHQEAAVFSGRATVEDRVILEMHDMMCALIQADTLEPVEQTKRMYEWLTAGGRP